MDNAPVTGVPISSRVEESKVQVAFRGAGKDDVHSWSPGASVISSYLE